MNTFYPRLILSGCIVCFLFSTLSAQNLQLNSFDIETIREQLPLAMDSADIPGLSLVWFEDNEAHVESFGYCNVEQKLLVQDNTIFEAASLSKPVTAYLTIKMAERGKLHLDAPVIQLVPKSYLEEHFFKGPYPGEIFNLVTPRMLLTHCTGFPNWRKPGEAINFHFKPGSDFQYSGEGFMLMQLVLEYVSDKPLDRLARTYVFDPLDMGYSSFVYQKEIHKQLSQGYNAANEARPLHQYGEPAAAYSLLTTAGDYMKFMRAILEGKGLKRENMDDLLNPQRPVNYGAPGQYHWGLGLGLEQTPYGRAFWHWGDNGPFKCFMIGFPVQKKALAFFTNSSNGLALGELIIKKGLGIPETIFSHLEYQQYNSTVFQIQKILKNSTVTPSAKRLYDHFCESPANTLPFPEAEIVRLGYHYLNAGKTDFARLIFEINLMANPESWNAYDSLAEMYFQQGDSTKAIQYYRQSLQKNPGNINGKKMLKRLTEN